MSPNPIANTLAVLIVSAATYTQAPAHDRAATQEGNRAQDSAVAVLQDQRDQRPATFGEHDGASSEIGKRTPLEAVGVSRDAPEVNRAINNTVDGRPGP